MEAVLKEAFTNPTKEERHLYSRLASVYTILFCLRTEPRLIQYFQRMAGHFRFYVGSDVLVRALGERFVKTEQQFINRTLEIVRSAGGELVLAEPVLEEVQRHINASNHEFNNHYDECEEAITPEKFSLH